MLVITNDTVVRVTASNGDEIRRAAFGDVITAMAWDDFTVEALREDLAHDLVGVVDSEDEYVVEVV
jgi:hypothetical protein